MKRFSLLLLLFLALVACAPGAAEQRTGATLNDDAIVELVYQDWRTDWFPGMAQEMLDEFHQLHPNIRVYYTPDPEDVPTDMPPIFDAGTAPDVVNGCCDFFPAWAQAGYLLDLRPYVERDIDPALIAEWDSAQYNSFFIDGGAQYALPKYHGALAVYYNKDLFDQYGVPYPSRDWTHDDYLSAMQALTVDNDSNRGIDVWGSSIRLVTSNGAPPISGSSRKYTSHWTLIMFTTMPVSYTHLTLPTSDLV